MELPKDEIIQKYAKHCGHCSRNCLLPYEYEYTCFACGYNLIKKTNSVTFQGKKIYQAIKTC